MADNRALYLETGANQQPAEAATIDATFMIAQASYSPFSNSEGKTEVLPTGLETGGAITPTTNNDEVAVAAATAVMVDHASANAKGRISVAGLTISSITRPTATNKIIHAITITDAGTPIFALVAGTEAAAFSDTVGAAGGPPKIPAASILVGHIRFDDDAAAVVLSSEIRAFAAPTNEPVSLERFDYPGWKDPQLNFSKGALGQVEFNKALATPHDDGASGLTSKKVIIKGYSGTMTIIPNIASYSPPGISVSSSSTENFDGVTAEQTQGVADGSFEVSKLSDGIRDAVIAQKGKTVLIQYFEDETVTGDYIWSQGVCVPTTTFEGKKSPTASVTIAALSDSVVVKA